MFQSYHGGDFCARHNAGEKTSLPIPVALKLPPVKIDALQGFDSFFWGKFKAYIFLLVKFYDSSLP